MCRQNTFGTGLGVCLWMSTRDVSLAAQSKLMMGTVGRNRRPVLSPFHAEAFTLIELLVVIAIIGILAAIAAASAFENSQVILAHTSPDGKLEFLSTIMRDIGPNV